MQQLKGFSLKSFTPGGDAHAVCITTPGGKLCDPAAIAEYNAGLARKKALEDQLAKAEADKEKEEAKKKSLEARFGQSKTRSSLPSRIRNPKRVNLIQKIRISKLLRRMNPAKIKLPQDSTAKPKESSQGEETKPKKSIEQIKKEIAEISSNEKKLAEEST